LLSESIWAIGEMHPTRIVSATNQSIEILRRARVGYFILEPPFQRYLYSEF